MICCSFPEDRRRGPPTAEKTIYLLPLSRLQIGVNGAAAILPWPIARMTVARRCHIAAAKTPFWTFHRRLINNDNITSPGFQSWRVLGSTG